MPDYARTWFKVSNNRSYWIIVINTYREIQRWVSTANCKHGGGFVMVWGYISAVYYNVVHKGALSVMDWPPQRPVVTVIEAVWDHVEREQNKRQKSFGMSFRKPGELFLKTSLQLIQCLLRRACRISNERITQRAFITQSQDNYSTSFDFWVLPLLRHYGTSEKIFLCHTNNIIDSIRKAWHRGH